MSEKPNISNKLHTSCKDCKFAVWNGITQTACQFELLDKYKEVVPAYDEDKEFFVINNDVCLLKRQNKSTHTAADAVAMISIRYHAIVIYKGNKNFKKCLEHLVDQEIKPKLITIIVPHNIKINNITKIHEILNNTKIKWKMSCKLSEDTVANYIDVCIETQTGEDKLPWYLVVNSDFNLPKDYLKQFNDRLIFGLEQFGLVKPLDIERNGLLVKTSFHAYLGGSRKDLIENKFKNTYAAYKS